MSGRNRLIDTELELKAAGLVAADTAHAIKAIGAGVGRGDILLTWTALEIATGDEHYEILVLGSTTSDFSAGVAVLGSFRFGDGSTIATALGAGSGVTVDDSATGQTILPFINERNGVIYPWIRLYSAVTGTIATGFNFSAYLTKVGEGAGHN